MLPSRTVEYLYNNNEADKEKMKPGYYLTLKNSSLWFAAKTIKQMFTFQKISVSHASAVIFIHVAQNH